MQSSESSSSRYFLIITFAFVAWKALLAVITALSPGLGYDTSSSLLEGFRNSTDLTSTPTNLQNCLTKFVRWDAIYFTQISIRQYLFEQEWAFSFAFSKVVSVVSQALSSSSNAKDLWNITLAGVLVSHLAHLGAAWVVYLLVRKIYTKPTPEATHVALCSAILHVLSPAGIFMSAPYTESLFAFMNVSGFALYLRGMSRIHGHATLIQRLQVVAAGMLFGIATTIRSNGLLSGIPFLYDAIARTWAIANYGFSNRRVYDLSSLVIGGVMVAFGLVIPQMFAYRMYCLGDQRQPWCNKALPSIYLWVQDHYWNVGLFRYWTLSNIPLFILAAPMLWILIHSAYKALWPKPATRQQSSSAEKPSSMVLVPDESAIVRLALPQLALAIFALVVYNVQIITRLSSAYPLWYIWLAEHIVCPGKSNKQESLLGSNQIFRVMVMYAIIQAGLYASFLPPA